MTNEFKSGDWVKWVDLENDSEVLYGVVSAGWGGAADRTCVQYDCDPFGNLWFKFVPTIDLRHANEVGLWGNGGAGGVNSSASVDWSTYLVTDESIIVPPGKKGYEPDGFDREAFDDFMRNL